MGTDAPVPGWARTSGHATVGPQGGASADPAAEALDRGGTNGGARSVSANGVLPRGGVMVRSAVGSAATRRGRCCRLARCLSTRTR